MIRDISLSRLDEKRAKQSIEIKQLAYVYRGGAHRVSAEVNGVLLWFESSDVLLCPHPEGFASAFLVPALAGNIGLTIEGALCPVWLSNVYALMKIFGKWWGYKKILIKHLGGKVESEEKRTKTALCFTGGADSFYTLLRCQRSIDYLIFIDGYDIALKDADRLDLFHKSFKVIARETNTKAVVIKTNLREHPVFSSVSWERSHGTALAAIGHLISDVGCLLVSSSHPYAFPAPWGSHWKTDYLLSSGKLEIIHEGASLWRTQKLQKIADEPLVQKYLRVCWEHKNSKINCCQCEKCLRTMLVLIQCGKLDHFSVFADRGKIVELIDQLPYVKKNLFPVYQAFCRDGLPSEIKISIRSLLNRSRREDLVSNPFLRHFFKWMWRPLPRAVRQKIKNVLRLS